MRAAATESSAAEAAQPRLDMRICAVKVRDGGGAKFIGEWVRCEWDAAEMVTLGRWLLDTFGESEGR